MTTDYDHCKNVTDTTSMCYNGYKQRSFLAQTNSKRDIAIDNLRDTLTTKFAELYWSDPTEKTVALLKPSGGPPDENNPGVDARNPFKAGVIDIEDGPPRIGYHTVYTPQTVLTPAFDLRDDTNAAAGYNQIRYIGEGQQLVEIKATAAICAGTTEREILMSVYKNDLMIEANAAGESQLREIAFIKSSGADDTTVNMELTFQTNVIKDDLLKLVLWRADGAGSANIQFTAAGLRVMTLP